MGGLGVHATFDGGTGLGAGLPIATTGFKVVNHACRRCDIYWRLGGFLRRGSSWFRRLRRRGGRGAWCSDVMALDRLVNEIHKERADGAVGLFVGMTVVIVVTVLGPQKVVAARQVAKEIKGKDVGMTGQVLVRLEPVGKGPRSLRLRQVAAAGDLRRLGDDDENFVRVLIHPVADGEVVGFVLGQVLVAPDVAGRVAGFEGDDVVLHQVAKGVVRRVVERLSKDLGKAVGVGVVARHVKVVAGVRAVGQVQPVVVVAVVVELVAEGVESLPHVALLDQIRTARVVQKDDAGDRDRDGVTCPQEKWEQAKQDAEREEFVYAVMGIK